MTADQLALLDTDLTPVPGVLPPARRTVDAAAGEAAKTEGMGRAEAHTPDDWAQRCQAAIRELATRGEVFQAADLIAAGLIDEPDSPARWGPAFLRASRAGTIRTAGYAQSKRATVHRSICRAWTGAEEARTP